MIHAVIFHPGEGIPANQTAHAGAGDNDRFAAGPLCFNAFNGADEGKAVALNIIRRIIEIHNRQIKSRRKQGRGEVLLIEQRI